MKKRETKVLQHEYAIWKLRQGSGETHSKHTRIQLADPIGFFLKLISSLNLANSSLGLLFNNPVSFFETNWPSLREWLHRLTYTLEFETPLRLSQNVEYEFIVPDSNRKTGAIIYICNLSDYLPALHVYLNGKPQVVLKVDEAVSIILDRVWKLKEIKLICKHLKQKLKPDEVKEVLRQAIRAIVLEDVPMFIRIGLPAEPEKINLLSIACVGNPFGFYEIGEFENFEQKFLSSFQIKLPSSKDIRPLTLSWRIVIKLWRIFKSIFFLSPMDEPELCWEIFSKAPSESIWTYVFAPKKFHLSLKGASASNDSVEILHVSSEDPDAVCLRLRARKKLGEPWRARVRFKILTPLTHKLWLSGISFVLLLLGVVWAGAAINSLGGSFEPLNQFWFKCSELTSSLEFFSATVTLISFLFVARNWLIYEETAFRLTSLHLSFMLVVISICAFIVLFL